MEIRPRKGRVEAFSRVSNSITLPPWILLLDKKRYSHFPKLILMDEGASILVGKSQESQTEVERRNGKIQDDVSTQCNKVGSECGMDYSSEFITQEIFKSREALIKWARDVGRRNGFVIVIKTSNAGGHGKKPRLTLVCERSGYYRDTRKKREVNTKKKMKLLGSKKCGCPFSLQGINLGTNDDWMLHVVCGVHNHPVADFLEGHSFVGRLAEEETSLLADMSKSMARPKKILVTLKQRCDLNVSTMKTIYNARHRFKVAERARRTSMQKLFARLAKHKYIEWHRKCDDTETVADLLWTHPTGLDLLRAFPYVLMMDGTYKANRYRMPLLEIIGVTSTEKTFSVCFAYLQYEREDNYAWALGILRSVIGEGALPSVIVTDREITLMKAISTVFPGATHFLCRWHINRNVSAKCKKMFETKEKWDRFIISWNMLVSSSTEEQYNMQLAMLNKEFKAYPKALEYVRCSWLDPYRDRFVAAWTDRSMHFGNTTISKVESSHAQLKRHLGSSQWTSELSWTKIHNLLELQHTNIKVSFEKSKRDVQHNFKPLEFKELWGNISISALEKILVEMKRANSVGIDQDACGCVIRRTHSLPCAHEIAEYIREGRSIPLDCIYPHWCKLDMLAAATPKSSGMELDCILELEVIAKRFKEYDSSRKLQLLNKLRELAVLKSTFLIEPEIKSRTRGCPHLEVDTSTRRDPCAFELVQSRQDSYSPVATGATVFSSGSSLQPKPKRIQKQKVIRTRSMKPISYIDLFPDGLRPYIHHVKDVKADGNCGFRAIAGLMGFGEDEWPQVRKDLLIELHAHVDHYRQLYGTQLRVDELIHTLSYLEDCPPHDRWMTMPEMGHLISSHYNVVLYHLSTEQCLTFLPLRSVPLPKVSRREIAIGFVNQNHFVEVFLVPGHPTPPIATNWRRYHHSCAQGWESAYQSRIQHFTEIVGPDVTTCETETIELN
eukprot:TRINITY_DN3440_c2_g1_i6.p1 TRINITY_DN3440_c2_g1~~TRINITY_DN3440_c2_g1_i6.p1  ORF type:complete len:952 (-),score=86.58 TRINITY_DN3440_c2_g1_i6:87-2942(-)